MLAWDLLFPTVSIKILTLDNHLLKTNSEYSSTINMNM